MPDHYILLVIKKNAVTRSSKVKNPQWEVGMSLSRPARRKNLNKLPQNQVKAFLQAKANNRVQEQKETKLPNDKKQHIK